MLDSKFVSLTKFFYKLSGEFEHLNSRANGDQSDILNEYNDVEMINSNAEVVSATQ